MFAIIKIIFCLLPTIVFPFSPVISFVSAQRQVQIQSLMIPTSSSPSFFSSHKPESYIQITRIRKNFIPTSVLILLSGYIGNPHWKQWVFTKKFISVFTMVHMITSASMVINDIFDLPIDRINHPERALASGKISVKEATAFFTALCGICICIGREIPKQLQPYWMSSLILVTTYTPIFKQITLLKNIVCAGIVTLTVPFVGLTTASTSSITMTMTPYTSWMLFFMNILFVHSFCNEILLDMLDVEGDAMCGIPTLPVIMGKPRVFRFLLTGLYGNACIVGLSILLTPIQRYKQMLIMLSTLVIVYKELLENMYDIWATYFSEKMIRKAVTSSTKSLLLCVFMYIIYTIL